MKVSVQQTDVDEYRAWVTQDHQSFPIGPYCETQAEVRWYVKMFRIALSRHDAETIERYFKGENDDRKLESKPLQPKRRRRRKV